MASEDATGNLDDQEWDGDAYDWPDEAPEPEQPPQDDFVWMRSRDWTVGEAVWPTIATLDDARKYARVGAVLSGILGVLAAGALGYFAVVDQDPAISVWELGAIAVISIVLAAAIWRMSRLAAAIALSLQAIEVVFDLMNGGGSRILLAVVIAWAYVHCLRGTIKYHQLVGAEST